MDAYTGWAGLASGCALAVCETDFAAVFLGNYCANLKMIAYSKLALERALEVIKLNLKYRVSAKWSARLQI